MLPLLWLLGCPSAPKGPPPNVLVVTLDTVRADHLGAYGYDAARTPVLDDLAARGTLFETAISVAPITMPTHSSIFTGLYPVNHGVRDNGSFALDAAQTTLAERAREAGYDTGAVVSAFVLDSRFGLDQGFRVYDDDLSAGDTPSMFMFKEVRADVSVDKALSLIDGKLEEPWLLWVHLFDAHADYEPPPPYDVLFHDQPYDGEIAWVDKQLGRLMDGLRTTGQHDRTVVNVLADHGDSLGEHGESTHGIFVYRSTTQVPWIVAGPGVATQRLPGVVSQVDVAPTLGALMQLPATASDGLDLSDALRGGRAVSRRDGVYLESLNPRLHFGWHELRAVDAGTAKYIDAPTPELYDLATDPGESDNQLPGGDASALSSTLAGLLGDDDVAALQTAPVDSQTGRMLAALGYVDLDTPTTGALPDPKDLAHRWNQLQRCQALLRAEQPESALPCLEDLLRADPDNWTARMSFARALRELGQFDRAHAVLTDALQADPQNLQTPVALADVTAELGKPAESKALLDRAAELHPASPDPWSELGDLAQDAGDGDAAVAAYGQALRRDESHLSAYVGLSNTFFMTGELDRAAAYAEEGLARDETHQPLWYNLAVVRAKQGDDAGAEEAYRASIALVPEHAMSHNNLASVLERRGDRAGAMAAYRTAVLADPNHVESRYNLATLLLAEQPAKAIPLLEDALRLSPDLLPAWLNLGHALQRVGRVDDAASLYGALLQRQPGLVAGHLAMARLEAGRKDAAAAKGHLRQALATDPAVRDKLAADPVLGPLLP